MTGRKTPRGSNEVARPVNQLLATVTASKNGYLHKVLEILHQSSLEPLKSHDLRPWVFFMLHSPNWLAPAVSAVWTQTKDVCFIIPKTIGSMCGTFTYTFTMKINHPCRQIYQSHGSMGNEESLYIHGSNPSSSNKPALHWKEGGTRDHLQITAYSVCHHWVPMAHHRSP